MKLSLTLSLSATMRSLRENAIVERRASAPLLRRRPLPTSTMPQGRQRDSDSTMRCAPVARRLRRATARARRRRRRALRLRRRTPRTRQRARRWSQTATRALCRAAPTFSRATAASRAGVDRADDGRATVCCRERQTPAKDERLRARQTCTARRP